MRRLINVVLLLLVLAGCGGMIKSNVVTFHDLPGSVRGVSYMVLTPPDKKDSLEYKTYENLLRIELKTQGFVETSFDQAELLVLIWYGIDSGQQENYSIPIFGQTGVSSSTTYGSLRSSGGGYGTYSGTTTYTPTYGIVGAVPASRTIFTRFVQLGIIDKTTFIQQGSVKKLYEGRVTSQGKSGELSEILPVMIKSIFEEFPGKSGKVRTSWRFMR
ncbi:MAG: DUF4136 domain-containing protein [Deltaproteobacteria bacterium]|nr:DUF4136 domain-containing protein [Deltaproteobacteria bacterium]